jgi:putative transcriptional regulator
MSAMLGILNFTRKIAVKGQTQRTKLKEGSTKKMNNEPLVHNRVKLARVEKGYTQQELADLVGVTRQTIGLIEGEKYNPTITLCLNLARILEKKLDDLFWLEGGTKNGWKTN